MKYLQNDRHDPCYNLAFEEYFTRTCNEDLFILWRNAPAVIVGRNQNTRQEVDIPYAEARNIRVVRRMSGGGAVYHDLGNVNFSYITRHDERFGDFAAFVGPVVDFLRGLGVPAQTMGRNDIGADGKKISGNAQYVCKNNILHHGTLLFNTDLATLSGVLTPSAAKIESRGVKSVRSRVGSIRDYTGGTAEDFWTRITEFFSQFPRYDGVVDELRIEALALEKYRTWEWNFGYSPPYTFRKACVFDGGMVEVFADIRNGVVESVSFRGDFFSSAEVSELEQILSGTRHTADALRQKLASVKLSDYFTGIKPEEIFSCLE